MVVRIPGFDVESLAVSRDSVTHTVPYERERTPAGVAVFGSVARIGESEDVDGGRTNGVIAT